MYVNTLVCIMGSIIVSDQIIKQVIIIFKILNHGVVVQKFLRHPTLAFMSLVNLIVKLAQIFCMSNLLLTEKKGMITVENSTLLFTK